MRPFIWPYRPFPAFVLIALLFTFLQMLFKRYEWKLRFFLPVLSAIDLGFALAAFLLLLPVEGLFFREIDIFLVIAVPGMAGLLGAGIGQAIGLLWKIFSE